MNGVITLVTAVIGFAVTAGFGFILIPFLKKIHFGQTILDIGPKWHKDKQGTPIMGGFMFMLGTAVAVAMAYIISALALPEGELMRETHSSNRMIQLFAGIGMALMMSFVGFIDDYIKAVKKQNLGLRARQKTMLQLVVAAVYLLTMYSGGMKTTILPFIGEVDISSGFGLIFWPIALIFIYGFTNAVNITDGVDGLAASVTFVVTVFYLSVTTALGFAGYGAIAAGLVGSLVGFLMWNLHPCKVMMGDTGSMLLGGLVVALAFSINRPILLILAGVLYFGEAMSVVIQVAYYKRTRRRLFKMSPIHHHFEMSGWSENKIVVVFSAVALVGCLIALLLI